MTIYKACDIRGVYGEELDEATAEAIGGAIAARLAGRDLVLGADLRPSSSPLKWALVRGLIAGGVGVVDIGVVPTPVLYDAKDRLATYGAVMVTASHNPPRYNGFKVMFGDRPVTPDDISWIAEHAGPHRRQGGTYRTAEALAPYADAMAGDLALERRPVVVDAGTGAMWWLAPMVLRRVGLDVQPLHCLPDGTFRARHPNPAVAQHLGDLSAACAQTGAWGAAYDGDGDRVIFVDELGRVLPADRVFALLLAYALAGRPGAGVVYDLKSSLVVPEAVERASGIPLEERSGHAFIKARMQDEGAVLGGEISGHYFFGDLGRDDALYATLMLAQLLEERCVTLAEAMAGVPSYPITPDLRLPCGSETAQEILADLDAAFAGRPRRHLDGVKVLFGEGWALARRSVTEPVITLRFEARTEAVLAEIKAEVLAASSELRRLASEAGW
ncbi:MAG: phosphomannomutase/phosphoglucomutase [Anaerolineae bacterium]|jgi:phosphomannomutase/phosphoglucomutase